MKPPKTLDELANFTGGRAPGPDKESDRFIERTMQTMGAAANMKANMIRKGLFVAKAKCPYCAGYWQARLAKTSRRNRAGQAVLHLHLQCDGVGSVAPCGTIFME